MTFFDGDLVDTLEMKILLKLDIPMIDKPLNSEGRVGPS